VTRNVKSDGFHDYDRVKYFAKSKSFFSRNATDYIKDTDEDYDKHAYNLTAPLEITIEDSVFTINVTAYKKDHFNLNPKMCRNHKQGFWDNETNRCYYNYRLSELCIVVDHLENDEDSDDYDNYDAESISTGKWHPVPDLAYACGEDDFADYEIITKTSRSSVINVKKDYGEVKVYIRHAHSPYLYYDESDIDYTSNELAVAGIIMIGVSVVVIFGVLCYLCRRKKLLKEVAGQGNYDLPSLANRD
jgi:hypothetical protein